MGMWTLVLLIKWKKEIVLSRQLWTTSSRSSKNWSRTSSSFTRKALSSSRRKSIRTGKAPMLNESTLTFYLRTMTRETSKLWENDWRKSMSSIIQLTLNRMWLSHLQPWLKQNSRSRQPHLKLPFLVWLSRLLRMRLRRSQWSLRCLARTLLIPSLNRMIRFWLSSLMWSRKKVLETLNSMWLRLKSNSRVNSKLWLKPYWWL